MYNRLPEGIEKDTDNFLFINAGDSVAEQSQEDINRKIEKVKNDPTLSGDDWPVKRSVDELKSDGSSNSEEEEDKEENFIKEVNEDDLPF